jgi:membrane-bound lytic murein transglycosylase D
LRWSFKILFLALLLFGCSSKEAIKPLPHASVSVTSDSSSVKSSNDISQVDSISVESINDSTNGDNGSDLIINQSLESARNHYMSALEADTDGDSLKSATEFEYAINILNQLSYYPGIEKNQEFNDLSRSIIEDYETYIVSIDSLGEESSIFALREKLNQVLEATETPETAEIYTPTKVIPGLQVPLVINGLVEMNINYFIGKGRHHMERWLERASKIFPVMEKIFEEEKVPQELIYLSMIESGLNPQARSWAKAVGIWQFIKGTGKLYGLDGNWWYDERRNIEKATRAAAQHLRDLYSEFQDWHLAIAAYNSGAGNVKKAVRKSGTTVFWFMRKYLPRETRNYIPQYIAAAVIALDPAKYGFTYEPQSSPDYDIVNINECVDLRVLSECAGTTVDTLRELNSELIQMCTPPGYRNYKLKIPSGRLAMFEEKYAQIPNDQKRDWAFHIVKKGETLAKISRRYGISKAILAEANNISINKKISPGRNLIIPISSKVVTENIPIQSDPSDKQIKKRKPIKRKTDVIGKTKLTYIVKKGDTLGKISEMFDVHVSDLRIWNDIPYSKRLRANAAIEIYVPSNRAEYYLGDTSKAEEKSIAALKTSTNKSDAGHENGNQSKKRKQSYWTTHVVQRGETLGQIAKRYGVAVLDIKNWNGFRTDKISPKQELEIYLVPDVTESNGKKDKVTNSVSKNFVDYRVRKGDTLFNIANKFNVTVDNIKSWNNFKNNKIKVGQVLRIYSQDET